MLVELDRVDVRYPGDLRDNETLVLHRAVEVVRTISDLPLLVLCPDASPPERTRHI